MTNPSHDDTAVLVAHWKQLQAERFAAAVGQADGRSTVRGVGAFTLGDVTLTAEGTVGPPSGVLALEGSLSAVKITGPGIAVGAVLLDVGERDLDGQLVVAVRPAWRRILDEAARDPAALFALTPRQFEEFNAGAYEEEGWTVVLTPRSGDRGRDIIAHRKDYGGLRLVVQVKQLKSGRRVTAEEVRALGHVLAQDQAASKAVFTTTGQFAPGVYREFAPFLPTRLELRDGQGLQEWLQQFVRDSDRSGRR